MDHQTWMESDKKVHAFAIHILEQCEKEGMTMFEMRKLAKDFTQIAMERLTDQESQTSFLLNKAVENDTIDAMEEKQSTHQERSINKLNKLSPQYKECAYKLVQQLIDANFTIGEANYVLLISAKMLEDVSLVSGYHTTALEEERSKSKERR